MGVARSLAVQQGAVHEGGGLEIQMSRTFCLAAHSNMVGLAVLTDWCLVPDAAAHCARVSENKTYIRRNMSLGAAAHCTRVSRAPVVGDAVLRASRFDKVAVLVQYTAPSP